MHVFLKPQFFPSLSLFAVLSKPRQHFSATAIKPSVKALQDPFTLAQDHTLARGFGNRFATRWGLWTSAHSAMVLTSSVGQCLCLTRLASASGIRATSVLIFHKTTSR
jgi:hypothetical protein